MNDHWALALPLLAGMLGGAMNALAGGGTFATLPALIAIGLPANAANATSNLALLPGASVSAWVFRGELAPVGGVPASRLAAITFTGGLAGGLLLLATPVVLFDRLIPWLLLFAFVVLLFGQRASRWLRRRVSIGPITLQSTQALLGVYGGYFGGGVGLITTALYGLLTGIEPRALFAVRTLMLAVANLAATGIFIAGGLIRWEACLAMLAGALAGGWLGAHLGKALPPLAIRLWTIGITAITTLLFFQRAYG